jgi:thiol-disulfide isomerase/thioredoxin
VSSSSVPAASPAGTAPSGASSAAAELAYVEAAAWTADPARFAGRRVVLFFHAPWCPNCRANEKDIKERLAAGTFPAGLTVVKVDYDSSTDLKARYGVVQQDTFVPVDAAGAKAGAPVTDPAGVAGLVQAIG